MSDPEIEPAEATITDLPPAELDDDDESGHCAPPWLAEQWRILRCWLARGRVNSTHWVPRVGDRVRLHGRGTWLVHHVSIRRGMVGLGLPGEHSLESVRPAVRDDLDELYGTSDWDLARRSAPLQVGGQRRELEPSTPELSVVEAESSDREEG